VLQNTQRRIVNICILNQAKSRFIYAELANILTSLRKVGNSDFRWNGNTVADFVLWAPGQPSSSYSCGALRSNGISLVDCDSAFSFVCEKEGLLFVFQRFFLF
jgi:hypothetical protein